VLVWPNPGRCLEEAGLRRAGRSSLPRGQPQQLQQPRVLRPQPRQLSLNHHRDLSSSAACAVRACRLPGPAPRLAPDGILLWEMPGQGRDGSRLAVVNAEGHLEREEPP
jgi:hypothetical protein